MGTRSLTNGLLTVIALCLIFIVIKMHGVVSRAEAQGNAGADPGRASDCNWKYIQVGQNGVLLTPR